MGQPLGLSWGWGTFIVVIDTFNPDVRRLPMCVPYSITVVVASNGAQGALGTFEQGVDSLDASDLAMVQTILALAQG